MSLYEKIIVLTTKPVVFVAVYLYILTCFWILNKTSICVNEILDFFFANYTDLKEYIVEPLAVSGFFE